MSPSRRRRNAKRMSYFLTAKLAEQQIKKEKKSKKQFRLSGEGQSVFHRKSTVNEAWLKRKAEQEEAVRKIGERRRNAR